MNSLQKEQLKVLEDTLDYIEREGKVFGGICLTMWIVIRDISYPSSTYDVKDSNHIEMKKLLQQYRPTKEFLSQHLDTLPIMSPFWWKEFSIVPRIAYLKDLIKYLKSLS